MSPRDRVHAAIMHQPTDRTPRHEHFWPEVLDVWAQQGLSGGSDMEDLAKLARSDIRGVGWYDASLRLPEEVLEESDSWQIIRDANGAAKRRWKGRSGVPEFLGEFAVQTREQWDEHKHRLTDLGGRLSVAEHVATSQGYRDAGYFVCWYCYGFWEAARDILGPETLLYSVAAEPDWVRDIFEHLEALFLAMYAELRSGGVYLDGLFFYDDVGYRNGLFISPDAYRKLLWPSHARAFRRVHEDGLPVILHTCGGIGEAIPLFIEAGVDCLQPLEAKAGLDLGDLKRRYGDRLAFMGNVDVMVLRTNDKNAIRREVLAKLECGTRGGGYVFHSDHSIPPEVTLDTYRFCQELVDEFDDKRREV